MAKSIEQRCDPGATRAGAQRNGGTAERARLQVLSNTIKEKRKQKAGKWSVPLPKVAPITEDEMFKVIKTGKRKSASGCPSPAIASRVGARTACTHPLRRQLRRERMETDGHESDLRRAVFHSQSAQVRAVYPADRSALH